MGGSIFGTAVIILLVMVMCAAVGGTLIGFDYRRKGRSTRLGVITGVTVGASIALLIMGSLTVAASNSRADMRGTLFGIGVVGAGALLLWLLRIFRPTTEQGLQINVPGLLRKTPTVPPVTAAVRTAAASSPPTNVFISYRREDSADVTGRIYDRLVESFGETSVFKDVDSIPFGVDFRKHLKDMITRCDVVLVVIGDHWLVAGDAQGKRRLDDPGDFVRIEIEAALQRDIRVIPLLVKGATMPKASDLPPELQEFAFRNGIPVRYDPDFHVDMERLIKSLESRPA